MTTHGPEVKQARCKRLPILDIFAQPLLPPLEWGWAFKPKPAARFVRVLEAGSIGKVAAQNAGGDYGPMPGIVFRRRAIESVSERC